MVMVRLDDCPGDMVVPVTASDLRARLGRGVEIWAASTMVEPVTKMAGTCRCGHVISRFDNYCSECGRMVERNG